MSIIFDHATFWYGDPKQPHALSNISLTLPLHQTICVVGKTGSGKSTLVDHISAAIMPCQGRVLINDMDTRNKKHQPTIRRMVGHVGQFPEHQLFADTVYDDIAFGPRNLGMSPHEIEKSVAHACELLEIDLTQIGKKNPFDLSGGQQRRVAIAGILAMNPEILILDEPMAGLDPQGKRLIKRWINELKASQMTIIIVTHSMEDAAEFADTLVIMQQGNIAAVDDARTLFQDIDRLEQLNLTAPKSVTFARQLLERARAEMISSKVQEMLHQALLPYPTTLRELEEALAHAFELKNTSASASHVCQSFEKVTLAQAQTPQTSSSAQASTDVEVTHEL